jgi:hypothetical protein
MSSDTNTTGVTCGARTANPSGAFESTPAFSGIRVARSFDFYAMFCRLVCFTSLSFISIYVNCLGVVMVMIAWRLDLQDGKFEDTKGANQKP